MLAAGTTIFPMGRDTNLSRPLFLEFAFLAILTFFGGLILVCAI